MVTKTKPPTSFVGALYGSEWGDILVDLLEQVPDLRFPSSVRTYAQMRNYPQLRGVVAAYSHPIRRAQWVVNPDGCRDVVAQLVADDLGLPVKGTDPEPSPARRRGVDWGQHLRNAVPGHLVYGFWPVEKRFEIRGGQARLVELGERVPASVADVQVNSDGSLKGIQQDVLKPNGSGLIKGENLVWYAHEREGANWVGRSLLRPAYGPWVLAMEMWRVHGTSIRRFGMGVPSVEAPAGGQPDQITQAQQLASAMRAGETAGMGLPNGFTAKLVGLTGSVPDALAFIRYLDQTMSTMALADVMNLADSANGSRALGDVFVDLLEYAVQSNGNEMATEATRSLSIPLVDYNFGTDEAAPKIECGNIAADPEVTAEMMQALLTSGALSADGELESWARQKWGIPARDPNTPPAVVVPVAAKAKPRGRKVKAAALRRQPTLVEGASGVDFDTVQTQWQSAVDDLIDGWGPVTAEQIDVLVEQVAAAVEGGNVAALSTLGAPTDTATDRLEAAMTSVAAAAATTQADEAKGQGVDVAPGEPDGDRLGQVAAAVAAGLGGGLALSAARKALQAWTPGATSAVVAATVRDHLESLTDAALRDNLGAALSTAQNDGRLATLAKAPVADTYAASEILDMNSCEACVDVDGTEFDSLAEASEAYANGGFTGCQGGLRCRGIVVSVWDK